MVYLDKEKRKNILEKRITGIKFPVLQNQGLPENNECILAGVWGLLPL